MALRTIVERLSRGVVLLRHLPQSFGNTPIYVSPECGLRYYRFNLEKIDPGLLQLAVETVHKGDTVWDIGANLGLFSFATANLTGPNGKVFAIEPDVSLVQLLRRSAAKGLESNAPVTVMPVGISDQPGLASFHIAKRSRSANYLDGFGTTMTGGQRETQTILTVSLDWLLGRLPAPQVLKIDVEGAERLVLSGGTRVLGEARPTLILEVSGENSEWIAEVLLKNNYLIFDGDLPREARKPLKHAPWTTLAIPLK